MMESIQQGAARETQVGAAGGWGRLVAGLRALVLGPEADSAAALVSAVDEAASAALFAQALYDDSNLELDWHWLATQVTRTVERRYCLQKALYINPHNALTARQLLHLRADLAAVAMARLRTR
jgi:hypothetical protein